MSITALYLNFLYMSTHCFTYLIILHIIVHFVAFEQMNEALMYKFFCVGKNFIETFVYSE